MGLLTFCSLAKHPWNVLVEICIELHYAKRQFIEKKENTSTKNSI